VPRGLCHLTFGTKGGTLADSIWVRIPEVPARGLEGVTVTATVTPRLRVEAGEPVTLTVHVENRGEEDVLLVRRLAFPRELLVRVEDATGRRPSIVSTTGKADGLRALRPRGEDACRIARGLSWNRDRFDPAPGLTREDLVRVAPERGILREVELTRLLAGGLTPGRYLVRAGYRNTEPGARLGLPEDQRAGTGIVWSEPVTLIVE
jgi:hypothetical protein